MNIDYLGRAGSFETLDIPLFSDRVPAGFPSPASDYLQQTLDLNQLCIKSPASTYFVRVDGESMIDAGIFPGDILVVDRSLEARHGDIVIAELSGELTVKKLELTPQTRLVAMNAAYAPILLEEDDELVLFGVVTTAIHRLRTP